MIIRPIDGIVMRKVGEFYFLVDPRLCYNSDSENLFQTNDIGAFIWGSIDKYGSTIEEIISTLWNSIVDDKTDELLSCVRSDVIEFVEKLIRHGCAMEVE